MASFNPQSSWQALYSRYRDKPYLIHQDKPSVQIAEQLPDGRVLTEDILTFSRAEIETFDTETRDGVLSRTEFADLAPFQGVAGQEQDIPVLDEEIRFQEDQQTHRRQVLDNLHFMLQLGPGLFRIPGIREWFMESLLFLMTPPESLTRQTNLRTSQNEANNQLFNLVDRNEDDRVDMVELGAWHMAQDQAKGGGQSNGIITDEKRQAAIAIAQRQPGDFAAFMDARIQDTPLIAKALEKFGYRYTPRH